MFQTRSPTSALCPCMIWNHDMADEEKRNYYRLGTFLGEIALQECACTLTAQHRERVVRAGGETVAGGGPASGVRDADFGCVFSAAGIPGGGAQQWAGPSARHDHALQHRGGAP
eukprot:3935949-Rhodomonas_salina.1